MFGIPYQYKFKTVKEIPAPDGKVERREAEETATANAYFPAGKAECFRQRADAEIASRNL